MSSPRQLPESERPRRSRSRSLLVSYRGSLGARSAVADITSLAQRSQRIFDAQEDRRLEGTERATRADRQRDRSHGHVELNLDR